MPTDMFGNPVPRYRSGRNLRPHAPEERTPITCGMCGTVYVDPTPGEPHATRRMVEAGWLVVWLPRGASRRCPECHDGQM